MNFIIAATGHRPNKLGGYNPANPKSLWVYGKILKSLRDLKPDVCISGMAQGVDQLFALAAMCLEISVHAAIPFKNQENKWSKSDRERYDNILSMCSEVTIVSQGGYENHKYQVRNEWMVDHCDMLLAVWDGSPGGTANCIAYCERRAKPIHRIDPREFDER